MTLRDMHHREGALDALANKRVSSCGDIVVRRRTKKVRVLKNWKVDGKNMEVWRVEL